jgi:hypothetical protein
MITTRDQLTTRECVGLFQEGSIEDISLAGSRAWRVIVRGTPRRVHGRQDLPDPCRSADTTALSGWFSSGRRGPAGGSSSERSTGVPWSTGRWHRRDEV